MKYNIVIVDDEPLAHEVLLQYAARTGMLVPVKQFFSSPEALVYLEQHTPDILFLDIEMPELSGTELLASLHNKPLTIFVTAFLNYSLEGFELGVLDYLVKPVRYERFELAVQRAVQFLQLQRLQQELGDKADTGSSLLVKTGNKKLLVPRTAVTHVQAMKDYIIIYGGDEKYVVRSTMREMEEMLGSAAFIRVHKSFIVAKNKMIFFSGNKIELPGFEIPVGRKYKDAAERCFGENP